MGNRFPKPVAGSWGRRAELRLVRSPAGGNLSVSTLHVDDAPVVIDLKDNALVEARTVLGEKTFRSALAIERKRTERSKEPFLLMVVDDSTPQDPSGRVLEKVAPVLVHASRETDIVGWYKDRSSLGTLFTALAPGDRELIRATILGRLSPLLENELSDQEFNRIRISFHFFPDQWNGDHSGGSSDRTLYPDLTHPGSRRQSDLVMKRAIDIVGSLLVTLICLPLFLIIALAIKLTSKGPVLFRQSRVGQYGRPFVLFKFRTMHANNDPSVHREYVTKLIANQAESNGAKGGGTGVYKLTNDPRITRVGRFLRRSSLDELPQILNVLKGDMSLVGPRPPIPYELMVYETWHRRRVLEAKPGVTGLWQVTGRSQVRFDEMVRLDLRYATTWSLWLDLKILLRTPLAVVRSAGAY
jgi:lipopolysaccharide/colanic/teichoic acid biosynthesis glycosyltransferase